ncbi:CBS domain-containing protein [Elongatibacter sediminis]|uniref:CBS domain-containing protein n=1 Tax=Elongatibacter sediminis TaxID=3119006 RepID=A0AAW9REA8_9GAMM
MTTDHLSRRDLIRVGDVMKSGVDIVDGMLTVATALKRLRFPENRALFVERRHDDDEYGVVMFRDIAREVIGKGLNPNRVNIYEIMSKPVISVHTGMNVRYAIALFDRFGLSRAPVIDDGQIIGMVSYSDIVLKGMGLIPSGTESAAGTESGTGTTPADGKD